MTQRLNDYKVYDEYACRRLADTYAVECPVRIARQAKSV